MRIDQPVRTTTDSDCMSISVDDPQRKTLFVSEAIGVVCNLTTVKNSYFKNIETEKDGYMD